VAQSLDPEVYRQSHKPTLFIEPASTGGLAHFSGCHHNQVDLYMELATGKRELLPHSRLEKADPVHCVAGVVTGGHNVSFAPLSPRLERVETP
jgi:hypothetical protein